MTFTKPNYILMASSYQTAILLQFNDSHSLSYAELSEATNLADAQLKPVLNLLVKAKLLLVDGDQYDLNTSECIPRVRRTSSDFSHVHRLQVEKGRHGVSCRTRSLIPSSSDPNQHQPGYPSGTEARIQRCHEGGRRRPKVCLPGYDRSVSTWVIGRAIILTLLPIES